ncbi:uncharacterized protein KY384_008221 [Bacidia gigantensis]|uniref:uncharacterized protein n=1 Tax=Bacidia gigantensis TaxID=2732470 RepID=UPI001D051309|nr:uncharacterized protein KY384_008221 [Bacidia gigantensis]KAG8526792.1 hypothetical protein KY384_008221 [Bacidia gigantensis]
MDEFTADAFVNRDEPIPTISLPGNDAPSATSHDHKGKRERLKESTASKLKDKIADPGSQHEKKKYGFSLSDRLFTKLLQQIVPEDEIEGLDLPTDVRSSKYINRPSFSLPLMTNNFRRFNARIGVVFVFQNRFERLLTWRQPSHTLSLLVICTFICLDPYLLSIVPIVGALFFILIPAYLARHPPPPQQSLTTYTLNGPPLAPARTIKPAGETSKDFFRNMRDLQNTMDDFSILHDAFLKTITPPLNFSNEGLSSTIFLFLFIAASILFIASHLIPWRVIALLICWTAITGGHPNVRQHISDHHAKQITVHQEHAKNWLDTWTSHDIILDTLPETREVEVFELQHRDSGNWNKEWEPWLFTPAPYDPLSPQRISGDRPKGTRFFEDVQPPKGWEWGDKKWILDLASREWVDERTVQGIEVEIEGERWVTDLVPIETADLRTPTKGKERTWEDNDGELVGEWRRRRWIRMVRRKVVGQE